jgi:ABC-type branched-subunit amino acid transport system ATPase component
LTVFDNVALGWEASRAGRNAVRQVVMRPSERRERDSAIWGALGLCGLQQIAERPTHSISTGQRRLVELARALAGDFKVLLLDEPSAGLDHDETIQFGDLLTRVVDERGCGILLVEHDMSLVMRVCERIYVLDHGEEIFAGTPAEVAASPVVQLAYLGAEASSTQQVPEEVVR